VVLVTGWLALSVNFMGSPGGGVVCPKWFVDCGWLCYSYKVTNITTYLPFNES